MKMKSLKLQMTLNSLEEAQLSSVIHVPQFEKNTFNRIFSFTFDAFFNGAAGATCLEQWEHLSGF